MKRAEVKNASLRQILEIAEDALKATPKNPVNNTSAWHWGYAESALERIARLAKGSLP